MFGMSKVERVRRGGETTLGKVDVTTEPVEFSGGSRRVPRYVRGEVEFFLFWW